MVRRRMKGKRNASKNGPTSAAVGNQFNSKLIVASLFSWDTMKKINIKWEVKLRAQYLSKFAEGDWNLVIFVKNNHLVKDVGAIK